MESGEATVKTANTEEWRLEIRKNLERLSTLNIIPRIWKKDWTVWKAEPAEISNRLGWLESPWSAMRDFASLRRFAAQIRRRGIRRALLLGMGGSSLAPFVIENVFQTSPGGCRIDVLDTTVPSAVLEASERLHPARVVVIVSSKSGTTVETVSLFKYFWKWSAEALGERRAADHFVVITDPGTPLDVKAKNLRIPVFTGDPEIGGRFSALSTFNLLPAALKGLRLDRLVASARKMADLCRETSSLADNPAAILGTWLGTAPAAGRDKVTFILPRRFSSFGLWLEQLIAESTGKEGKGLLPVVGEPVGRPAVYGEDRLFIRIKQRGEKEQTAVDRLTKAGFPVLTLSLTSPYGIGGQFFLWEFATAVAAFFLGVNPFDQPDVESAKKKTREILAGRKEAPPFQPEFNKLERGGSVFFSEFPVASVEAGLRHFLGLARPGDYIAVQAFLRPGRRMDAALHALRVRLRESTGLAVTVGYGPRYLHSTGQLHKGDRGNGLFIQLTAADAADAPIPDEPGQAASSLSFGQLKDAQAAGDFEALRSAGRRVLRFHFLNRPETEIRFLASRLPSGRTASSVNLGKRSIRSK